MFKTLSTLTLACCLGLLAAPAPSWACDEEKPACSSKTVVTKTVDASGTCTSATKTVALGAKSDRAAACGAKKAASTVALGAKGDCAATCGSKAASTVALGAKGDCAATCGSKAASTVALGAKGDGAACTASTKTVADASTCSSSKAAARYVAFGCNKTDRVARQAARSYLDMMVSIKAYSGGEDCAAQTASQVLTAMLQDQQAERAVAAEAVDVSLGVVGDKATCSSTKAAKTVAVGTKSTCSGTKAAETVAVGTKSTCSGTKAAETVAVGTKSTCSSTKAAKTVAVGTKSTCSGTKAAETVAVGTKSTCSDTKAANTKTVADSSCGSGNKAAARYVAFGCTKTDRVARAAARSYLEMMVAIKAYSGADGCAAQTATQVLTAMLDDMQAERAASAAPAGDAVAVSLGAVGNGCGACPPDCCAKK